MRVKLGHQKGNKTKEPQNTETGEAAYPLVPDNAGHAVETTQSGAYKEADKASVEMDDKQRSAAIKERRGGSCKDRRLEMMESVCK